MFTITKLVVVALWSVALCTSTLAQTQIAPDQAAEINKIVKQCVETVHGAPSETGLADFYRRFDAYYNSRAGKVENNVTTMGDQKPFFVFKKCMSEKGVPLGG
jgi:hypothetical protein